MDINEAFQLARKHHLAGNLEEAEYIYREILLIQPNNVGAYYELGNVLQDKGQLDEAVFFYRKAIELDPNFAGSFNNLGNVFNKLGQFDEAVICYQKALDLAPDFTGGYVSLGLIFFHKNRLDEAIAYFEKALQLEPAFVDAYFNLGNIFKSKGRNDEALKYYLRAIELDPNRAEFYFNAGVVLQAGNKLDEAMTHYRKTIELDPDFARAYLNMSLILLLSGNFRQGWKEYEWRWKLKEFYQLLPSTSKPVWNGSDIEGLTILLYAEQGFGDTIQFIRYIPMVAERGAKVIVECQKELISLVRNVRGVDHVSAQGEKLPEFDIHCSLLSLPLIFDTTIDNIPATVPYITVNSLLSKKWKDRLGSDNSAEIKIGLVWSGNPTNITGLYRSCSLDAFSPLARPDITFYSLQKGDASIQTKNPAEGMRLVDYTEEIKDFSDTAALMENLDLVISVDTAVAHLAGALGKPVWTLIPFAPDWRWMLDREDSPWYPTMKLFRQPVPDNWEPVITKLSEGLKAFSKTDIKTISKERI